MVTEFGKYLRILRIHNEMSAKEFADKMDVSTAYLSAVENGKRNIPSCWEKRLEEIFTLSEREKNDLRSALYSSAANVKIDLSDTEGKKRELLMMLSRDDIDESTLERLCMVIKGNAAGIKNL